MSRLTGLIRGDRVLLDQSVPSLEGKRVVVVVQGSDETPQLHSEQDAWRVWAEGPLHGPNDDDTSENLTPPQAARSRAAE